MKPYVDDPDFTLWSGDALEVLRGLPDGSVHCCVTSPPFYALRDYGVEGQIGLEATPEDWVDALVAVFREIRRVLRPDGTCWIECGDSYTSGTGRSYHRDYMDGGATTAPDLDQPVPRFTPSSIGLKPKDLLGQPWMLAFALRADGWYLRQCIIWAKPNAMPESATDRCTTAHSYVFLLSRSPRYFFDADAISEPAEWARWGDQTVPKYEGTDTSTGWMQPKSRAELVARGGRTTNGKERTDEMRGFDNLLDRADGRKNARSVWTIPTRGYSEAHFATFPEALVERMILAGCPVDGIVLDPFLGSGTSALVARRLRRKAIGIELNEDYCELAARRVLKKESKPLASDVKPHQDGTLNLFTLDDGRSNG